MGHVADSCLYPVCGRFHILPTRKRDYKCDVIQLLKKEGTEKYLFRGSEFLSVSKEPGLRVLLVRCSGFLGFDFRRESINV